VKPALHLDIRDSGCFDTVTAKVMRVEKAYPYHIMIPVESIHSHMGDIRHREYEFMQLVGNWLKETKVKDEDFQWHWMYGEGLKFYFKKSGDAVHMKLVWHDIGARKP
jgi:hypothetical protein